MTYVHMLELLHTANRWHQSAAQLTQKADRAKTLYPEVARHLMWVASSHQHLAYNLRRQAGINQRVILEDQIV